MDEEIERMVIAIRADTSAATRDVEAMRREIDGPLQASAERAGRGVENALVRAVRTGKLGFEDLKKLAAQAMGEIAASAVRSGLDSLFGHGESQGLGSALIGLLRGAPGRATGGPVSPGRPYIVGERGPEWFVPTSSGQVVAPAGGGGGGRDVRVAITVQAGAGEAPRALAQSSRQVARAVKAALARE
jgi:hypothetical protein